MNSALSMPTPESAEEDPANEAGYRLQAVALRYREADGAPQIIAKGKGLIAEEILKRAKEAGIFVHSSSDLIGLLMQINLDDRIPTQLYVVVAELLAWVYRQDQEAGRQPKNNQRPRS